MTALQTKPVPPKVRRFRLVSLVGIAAAPLAFLLYPGGTPWVVMTVAAVLGMFLVNLVVVRMPERIRADEFADSNEVVFLQLLGREEGPLTLAECIGRADRRVLRPDTLMRVNDGDWFPASQHPALFSEKSWTTTLLLAVLLGGIGIDRFYLGKYITGILKLITFGGLGIWSLIDIVLVATRRTTDSRGRRLAD